MAKNTRLAQYIFPSAGGLCVTYLYNIVDGIFVGQGVGHQALAAVNITVPFITTLVAISSLFAMGGSTVIAIRLGRGDKKGANNAFMCAFVMTLLLSVILLLVGTIFPRQIAQLCGSSEAILPLAVKYLFYYTAFSIPFLLSNCLSVFVRNDGAPGLAFWGMCAGAAANIFLDWLFIFPLQMGIKGAAIASGLGQLLSFLLLIGHFVRKKGDLHIERFENSAALIGKICKRGVPECVSQLNTPVTALCYNWALMNTLGDMGVSTFSILSFIYSLANAILPAAALGAGVRTERSQGTAWVPRRGYENQCGLRSRDLCAAGRVPRTGSAVVQQRSYAGCDGVRRAAGVRAFIPVHGGQPDLHGLFLFHQADY